ncbi:MAG: hypothetical protein L6R40_003150 [Gallowayella cf. fulva]|nr:MAG: hypothetical protein L6R40_003150 [Xanthomendoza cf. fulva]
MSFSSTAETLTNMGNLCSTPSTTCCKRPCPFPQSTRRHARGCKRIKYTLVPQRDPDRHHGSTTTAPNQNNNTNNNHHHNGSPNTLHRSNAIRRPDHSRSQSSSPSQRPNNHPSRLQIRNTTPSPTRPTSIVPTPNTTIMLTNTPSTGPSSLPSHRSTTAPTSPTTILSNSFNYSLSSGSAGRTPRTLYMVDGEIVGGDEERLELRWIDALRAPGAPGGYRDVVDVVEERRSGRLTVVNGGGRGSEESVRYPSFPPRFGGGGAGGDNSVNGVFAPRAGSGRPSHRMVLEAEQQQRRRRRMMDVKRKPGPMTRTAAGESLLGAEVEESVVTLGDTIIVDNGDSRFPEINASTLDSLPAAAFRWRRMPMSRPPIPTFKPVVVTERELLNEVEDARRILDGQEERRVDTVEEKKDKKEEEEEEEEEGEETVVEAKEDVDVKSSASEEKEQEDGEMMDWFWVDDEGALRYTRGGLPS